jgi:hypothetical protein
MREIRTPILFVVFNRPELTKRVFQKIRGVKPSDLYIAADGPRQDRPDDLEKCRETREIINQIDWPCTVKTLFREKNLGCKMAVSSAIDWFFDQVEGGVILEDDCLPNQSFFYYCEDMLEGHKTNDKIMMISGMNICGEWKYPAQDYHFSYYGGIWGWATWRRAWKHYDLDMKQWNDREIRKSIRAMLGPVKYLERKTMYDAAFKKKIDTWDYQWSLARLANAGLAIVPARNLVSNIGFSAEATNSKDTKNKLANQKTFELNFPLRYNPNTKADNKYDSAFIRIEYNCTNAISYLLFIIKQLIRAVF